MYELVYIERTPCYSLQQHVNGLIQPKKLPPDTVKFQWEYLSQNSGYIWLKETY